MSSNGYRQAQLERERREQLRLEQVQSRARGLAATCQETIRAVTDPGVQQLAAKDLVRLQKALTQGTQQIATAPDQALATLQRIQEDLNGTLAKAETSARKWSKQQAEAKAQLEAARQTLEAERLSTNKGGQQTLVQAEQLVAQANSLYRQGRYEDVAPLCGQAKQSVEQSGRESFDESIRREVIRGLLATLTGMGFSINGPQLHQEGNTPGIVTLSGRMPSGKMARFEVNLDGRMQFDFDGYEGRACAKDLDQINATLQEQFAVKITGSQITWKNPDRIAKGARDLPDTTHNRHTH